MARTRTASRCRPFPGDRPRSAWPCTARSADETYFTLSGSMLGAVMDKLDPIVQANRALEQFHTERRAAAAAADPA
ncbi:MAG: hypothetical protein IT180_18250 [Acidobacteria bacterium]|nr:hypothetical protein [Acidobacteriota bacterium]